MAANRSATISQSNAPDSCTDLGEFAPALAERDQIRLHVFTDSYAGSASGAKLLAYSFGLTPRRLVNAFRRMSTLL